MDIVSAYHQVVKNEGLHYDEAQSHAAERLQSLLVLLTHYDAARHRPFWKRLKKPPTPPHGLYLYGDVGRGKSMLMDLFFEEVPIHQKRRIHFHQFMTEIHDKLHHLRQDKKLAESPIPLVAKDIGQHFTLLCLDELHMSDITDAMIVGRLFKALFENGVVIVTTSNRTPDDLYKDGVDRHHFLHFIDLIKTSMTLIHLNASEDYRHTKQTSKRQYYFTPLSATTQDHLGELFAHMTNHATPEPVTLHIKGRQLQFDTCHEGVLMVTFAELCERALGAQDYDALTERFHTIFLTDIPRLTREMRNEAKRFVTLVDQMYEHRIILYCSAEVPIDELYVEGDGSFEFQRTLSRLTEMQSEHWGKESTEKTG